MKRITILLAAIVATNLAFAKTNENFNSRSQASLAQVKPYLQNHCWQFTDFEINNGGWNPAIDGDGAMVSGAGNSSTANTGIFSQPLDMSSGNITVSFKYKFSNNVSQRRWLKLYVTDGNNNITAMLDSIELTGANNNTVYSYNKSFPVTKSCQKIYINYQGIGGSTRIAIDQLSFSESACFSNGCNQAPVAVNDDIPGASSHVAEGTVTSNDSDPENSTLTAQMVTNSTDGNVVLNSNGSFRFTPNAGFSGSSTSFQYIVCDNGTPAMCSNIATATITFPLEAALPSTITDLDAIYGSGRVSVRWASTLEANNDHFDIERSTDGIHFKAVGTVKGQGTSGIRNNYEYADNVKQNTIYKNDLYYRLKLVNTDFKSAFSKVLVVRVYQTKSLQSVSVTPNPALNDIKVNLQLKENSYIVMKVANSNGVEIMRKTTRGATGVNNVILDGTSRLQTGVYLLEVIVNSNERMLVKLIKS
jgi:hypothetical protein